MGHIIEVKDRIPTYAGRVTMTPVVGQENTYDMVRADMPLEEGTPINKALFDQKANRLNEDIVVYVSGVGSDLDGNGTSVSPYATVQKALEDIPKWLDGHHAQIDIADGTYNERVTVNGFYGGRLSVGVAGRNVTLRGVSVVASSGVILNVTNLSYSAGYDGTLLQADYGSHVTVTGAVAFNGGNSAHAAMVAQRGSTIVSSGVKVSMISVGGDCVWAAGGSTIALGTIEGSDNRAHGLRSESGSIVSYSAKTLVAANDDVSESGGRIFSGEDKIESSDLADGAVTTTKIAANAVSKSFTVTLNPGAAAWVDNMQTVGASGVTASNIVVVSPVEESFLIYGEAQIRCIAQAANALTFKCEGVPEQAVTVNVTCINK